MVESVIKPIGFFQRSRYLLLINTIVSLGTKNLAKAASYWLPQRHQSLRKPKTISEKKPIENRDAAIKCEKRTTRRVGRIARANKLPQQPTARTGPKAAR